MTIEGRSSAPRLWFEEALASGAIVELSPEAARHIAALRLHEGEPVTLFNGRGGEYDASLVRIARDQVTAKVGQHQAIERESPLSITLALGISAGDRMDFAIQKATELGVVRVVPLQTERSVVRLSGERAQRRVAHWRGVTIAACEQCGRNRLPAIEPVSDLDTFVAQALSGLKLLLAPGSDRRLGDLQRSEHITLLVGAEGGLSPRERERALKAGFTATTMGPRVLRTETAPLAALAALQALWGDA